MIRALSLFLFLLPTLARADGIFSAADKSQVSYTLVHKFHTVHAIATKGIEAKARLSASGAQLAVRIAVQSFDSQNANRDEHMLETVEAAKFVYVELKATAPDAKAQPSGESKIVVKGKLTFHGTTLDVEIPLTLKWASSKDVTVTGKFPISLEAYKIDRPSLMGFKVDDKVDIEVDLHLVE